MKPGGRTAIVTGALGGLGSNCTLELVKRGWRVMGIDNFDPGAASPADQHQVLNLLEGEEGFRFIGLDIRLTDRVAEISVETAPDVILHCAIPNLFRRPLPGEALIQEIIVEAGCALAEACLEAGAARIIVPRHEPFKQSDPRAQDKSWNTLLSAEESLRARLSGIDQVSFVTMPTLWGRGQSPRTYPLSALRKLISRVPVKIPPADTVVAILVEDSATMLIEMMDRPSGGGEITAAQGQVSVSALDSRSLLDALITETGIEPVAVEELKLPWGPPAFDTKPIGPHELSREVEKLVSHVRELPQMPPLDWPDRRGKGGKKRG